MKRKKTSPKSSIFKRISHWFSLLWLGFTTEIQDRILMSWKRLIKFIGISLVPIIYGVVCLVAFWNPIVGIGRAPIAIFNQDQNIILVETIDTQKQVDEGIFKIGALVNPNKDWNADDATIFQNENGQNDNSVENLRRVIATGLKQGEVYELNNGLTFTYDRATTNVSVVGMWEVMKSMMLPKTDGVLDEDHTFKTGEIAEGISLTNIHYISDADEIADQWQGSKYYVQIKLEKNYTANLFGWLGSMVNERNRDSNSTQQIRAPDEWKDLLNKMEIWTTFERNFIFGYYMQTFSTFASGMIYQAIPNTFTKLILGNFVDDLTINGKILNLVNGSNLSEVDSHEDYVLMRSGHADLPPGDHLIEQNVRPYSLFGNVDRTGGWPANNVGGKFVSAFNQAKAMKDLGLISILEAIFGPMNETVKSAILEFFKVLDKISDPEPLNAYIYRGITGQWTETDTRPSNEMQKIVLNFLSILGFNTEDPEDLIESITIFNQNEVGNPIITQEFFENKFSEFMIKNPDVFLGATSLKELPSIIGAKTIAARTGDINAQDFVGFKLQGAENGLYGIGLGQFFLVIGLWVGILMQTFVFDRAKRSAKLTPSTWYLSKTMLMVGVAMIQATLEVWVAYLAGWHTIGIEATLFMWLWFLAAAIMFVFLIQGLWFVVKDETIGKFMVVIVMVLSLASGGGTFPAFAQFKFFTIMGYIVPFTYVLKGLGAIIYGVSIMGTTASTTAVIVHAWAYFFVYIAIFLALGLGVGAKNRFKEMNYGSHYGRCVALAMIALKRDPDAIGFRTIKKTDWKGKNKYQYHWKALKPGFDLELYLKAREMFPFEGRFKWWERKHHDPVQKPNFSDEDIMTRNE